MISLLLFFYNKDIFIQLNISSPRLFFSTFRFFDLKKLLLIYVTEIKVLLRVETYQKIQQKLTAKRHEK